MRDDLGNAELTRLEPQPRHVEQRLEIDGRLAVTVGEFVAQLCGNGLVSLVVDGNHGRVVFYKSSLPGDWLIIQFLNFRT